MLELENEDLAAHDFLERHAFYQRSLFDATPVLKTEPFALKNVYVETACGVMTAKQIKDRVAEHARGKLFDPFSDAEGGRHDLLATVMKSIADPKFRDAIVVQGVAGAGKSAFTLRLVAELLDRGLTPIRVRLRDVDMNRPINEALGRAIADHDVNAERGEPGPRDPLLGGRVFDDVVPFGNTTISRYALILDGWDEIILSGSPGFRERVETMLSAVRSEYLNRRGAPIRVILTGRPSQDVNASTFFRDDTPVLTVRALSPDQLETFVNKLSAALKAADPETLAPVLKQYREQWAERETRTPKLEILGQPLLAHIAMRLFAVANPADVVADSTTLFRSLIDITCEKGGQSSDDDLDPAGRQRLVRVELRALLRETATAITINGDETISFAELKRRLDQTSRYLRDAVKRGEEKHPLSQMVISFFFKGGHEELGCEFLHKSFREYLYAEHLVETLKEFGRTVRKLGPERTPEEYWRDFDRSDPRWALSRQLARMTAAQWMSKEVAQHLGALLGWEIVRATGRASAPMYGTPTETLDLAGWEVVRDALADLWDWWGEGVHQRPQPVRTKDGRVEFERSLAEEMVEWCASLPELPEELPPPFRVTTIDAHVGDALFRMTACVHYAINQATGWNPPELSAYDVWHPHSSLGTDCRRYQRRVRNNWVVFAPAGDGIDYFSFYVSRINAAGFRRSDDFPNGVDCRGLDLKYIELSVHSRVGDIVNWNDCNLTAVTASGCAFLSDSMVRTLATHAVFTGASFSKARLRNANFTHANLVGAYFGDADASGIILTDAEIEGSNWVDANVTGAIFNQDIPELISSWPRDKSSPPDQTRRS
jgi:hypothetical protein